MRLAHMLPLLICLSTQSVLAVTEDQLATTQPFDGRVHTYRIPVKYVSEEKQKSCGLQYYLYTKNVSVGRIEQVRQIAVATHPDVFRFHRRTHNGTAGSGINYYVRYSAKLESDQCIMTATAFAQSSYQQGLFGKFGIPKYDIENTLNEPYYAFAGEFDSPYNEPSVRSNFERLAAAGGLASTFRNSVDSNSIRAITYRVSTGGTSVPITLECFPYRNGTKCKYSGIVFAQLKDNVLDFGDAIRNLELAVTKIALD